MLAVEMMGCPFPIAKGHPWDQNVQEMLVGPVLVTVHGLGRCWVCVHGPNQC